MSMSMSESGNGSSGNETPLKKAKILDPVTDQQAIEEAALKKLIWDSSKNILGLCKKLSDKLYHSLLDAVAMLVYLLFDKDDLYRMHLSRTVYDQRSEFWAELEQELDPTVKMMKPAYKACKFIVHKKVDKDKYSLLNEYDLGSLLSSFHSDPDTKPYINLSFQSFPDTKPYINVPQDYYGYDKEFVESAMDDDIQKAIRKAKLCPRLSVDEYTSLLIEMVRDVSNEWRDSLLKKAVEKIDREVVNRLHCSSIEELIAIRTNSSVSAQEKLVQHIELHLWGILSAKTSKVQDEATSSVMPHCLLFNYEFLRGPSARVDHSKVAKNRRRLENSNSSLDSAELIEVAELRRKAEGSRFIQTGHLLWAFDERGCGVRRMFEDFYNHSLASSLAPKDHPPYDIYQTANILAQAAKESLQAEHIAFAVLVGRSFGDAEGRGVFLLEYFRVFKSGVHWPHLIFPKKGLKAPYRYDTSEF